MENVGWLTTFIFIFFQRTQTLCCQILHVLATLPSLPSGDKAISSLLELEPPDSRSAMIGMGYHPARADIPGDTLFRKDTQLDYFCKSVSFLEHCLDPAPLWRLFYYLSAGSCRLNLYNIYIWRYDEIIHSTNAYWVSSMSQVLWARAVKGTKSLTSGSWRSSWGGGGGVIIN